MMANMQEEWQDKDLLRPSEGCMEEEDVATVSRLRRILSRAPAMVGLVLLVAAVFVIWRELRHLSFHDVEESVRGIPSSSLLAGLGATVLSYVILSFYDRLACLHVKADISYRRSAFAAFCSYVLSHNLGCAAISGAAVRFRLYRSWGVAPGAIAQIIAFCSATYLLGTLALVGSILLFEPHVIPVLSCLPAFVLRLIGAGCLGSLIAYVAVSRRKRELNFRGHIIELPGMGLALSQIIVSAADMSATALIAYCVLPTLPPEAHFGFGTFLAIYIASYTAGLVASVPGGLGVFDSAMLLALQPYLPVPRIMGAILVFRLFYYIIPLVMAGLMFAGHEIFLRGEQALIEKDKYPPRVRPSQVIRESEADFSVAVATGVQAVVGVLSLIYALAAPLPHIGSALAIGIAQIADLLLSVVGVSLVGLAVGLSQRVALAWKVSLGVLAAGIVLMTLRHALWEASVVLALVMLLLAPFRNCYYRRAHLLVAPLSPSMLAPISLWLLGLAGVGWVAVQRHLGPIWWRSMIYDAHTAVGRWFLAISALCGLFALWRGMGRARIRFELWNSENEREYRSLAHALQEFGCRRPNGLLHDEAGRAAIPFLRTGQFIIGLGDPAGAERNSIAAIWRLRDFALQEGKRLAFVSVGQSLIAVYNDLGLTVCPSGPAGTICCFSEDYRALRAFLSGEERRARKRASMQVSNPASSAPRS
ncbi:lysylphosphatidylglycerol synthetase family protein [Gluconobacter wancherniae]|uniref:lysylphosphatidylglycerol synthase domain-containing protein n=1 Tax=Gluconobacter wancherniae TaxID=1307955 RepID=UPI001B8D6F8F|nr:lysylphosphatidylglycerol synthase domain-containing protein [Gluconobacter wancherniae]MBS1061692.1 lysylphosphatidylglycerol synthetase family protein [Gluconobacter wancherniae]